MKITSITQQIKRVERYSIFVDGKYEFSLSGSALLDSKLVPGQELTQHQVSEFKKRASDDKLFNLTLHYLALRPRTRWEIETYLVHKKASPALTTTILNKLSNSDLINDEKFARNFVSDRQLLRPSSKRKLIIELRQKHIPSDVIDKVMDHESENDLFALRAIVERKRKQARYQDDLKLMQYLARQGFNYQDIKAVLQKASL